MKTKLTILILSLTALLLAGCASPAAEAAPPEDVIAAGVEAPTVEAPAAEAPAAEDAEVAKPPAESEAQGFDTGSRLDEQGAVVVDVTPANLNSPAGTLDFGVGMNTHSVDLSMDLAALSTLTTDTGVTVEASGWTGAPGGHHISGTLSFPATADGAPVLEGASEVRLTIRGVDAPERIFVWKLAQ